MWGRACVSIVRESNVFGGGGAYRMLSQVMRDKHDRKLGQGASCLQLGVGRNWALLEDHVENSAANAEE